MYIEEGKDKDLRQINTWFWAVANYINSYGIKETDLDTLQYYGAYSNNSVVDQFKIFSTDIPDERYTIPVLKRCFETYFLLFTTLDNLWHKWESVKQTQHGWVQPIIGVIIKFKNLHLSLPRNTISVLVMKQQFLNAMDTCFKRVV
jgi:hypothetical protein